MALARHSFFYMVGRIISALIGLFSLFAFTHVLSNADYGRYSVLIAVASLISAVGFQWLRQCLVKFGPDKAWNRERLLGSIGALYLVLLLALPLFAATVVSISPELRMSVGPSLVASTATLACAQAWYELGLDASRLDLKPIRYGVSNILRGVLCLAFGILAAYFTGRVADVILGLAVGYLLSSLLTAPRWLSGLTALHYVTRAQVVMLVKYGLPLALTLGFTFIVDSADRLMLAAIRGPTEAGIYAAAYNLAQYALGSLLAGVGLAIFPLAAKSYADQGDKQAGILLGQNMLLIVGLAMPAMLGLIEFAPSVAKLILGNFVPVRSALILSIVSVGIVFGAVRSYAFDIVFMLTKKTHTQASILGGAAIVNLLLNFLLIPRFGAIGAASATLLSFLLAFCFSAQLARRFLAIRVRWKELVKIVIASVVMMGGLIFLPEPPAWPGLLLQVFMGALIYGVLILLLNPGDIRAEVRRRLIGVRSWNG